MYYTGDHIRIEDGIKVETSRIDMVARRNPQIVEDWRNSGSELLLSTYISRYYQNLIQNEMSLRNGSKITVVAFFSAKNSKTA